MIALAVFFLVIGTALIVIIRGANGTPEGKIRVVRDPTYRAVVIWGLCIGMAFVLVAFVLVLLALWRHLP
jgi:heme/copper-type cytochrome/quinol oxidase subunit 1